MNTIPIFSSSQDKDKMFAFKEISTLSERSSLIAQLRGLGIRLDNERDSRRRLISMMNLNIIERVTMIFYARYSKRQHMHSKSAYSKWLKIWKLADKHLKENYEKE